MRILCWLGFHEWHHFTEDTLLVSECHELEFDFCRICAGVRWYVSRLRR